MKKKIIAIAVMLFAVVVLVACVFMLSKDRKGPVISIPDDIAYKKGMSNKALLDGVSASDSKDGDVTDSLIVKSVVILSSGRGVKITYAAKDSHNNISEKSVVLDYNGEVDETSEENNDNNSQEETTPDAETTSGEPEETTPVETVNPEAPVLYLTETEQWYKVGTEVKWLKFVAEITDDKDDRNTLFRTIRIENYADLNTPGDYDMLYYCSDSDGNFSPKVTLHVHVIE